MVREEERVTISLEVADHPRLALFTVTSEFPAPFAELETPPAVLAKLGQAPPVDEGYESLRASIRDLLRVGGFKPTGRSKPASEYLRKAIEKDALASINAAVDIGNAVSLHTGVPISVVDLDAVAPPLSVAIAESGASFIFNRSGQTIDVGGLLCLADAEGPCANAVKDSQRTKTSDSTRRTLTLIWGERGYAALARDAAEQAAQFAADCGADAKVAAFCDGP